jgi:uncharacterized membrane protein YhaH (DUF805 family)
MARTRLARNDDVVVAVEQSVLGRTMTNIVRRYLSFEGRLARLQFFGRGIFLGVVAAALGMASIPIFSREGLWWWFGILVVAAALVLHSVGSLSLTIRRLHDLGLSGYHAIWVGAAQALWAPFPTDRPESFSPDCRFLPSAYGSCSGPVTAVPIGSVKSRVERE